MSYDVTVSAAEYLSKLYNDNLEKCIHADKLMETPAAIAKAEKERETVQRAEELLKLGILNKDAVSEYYYLENEIKTKSDLISKLYGIEADSRSYRALHLAKDEYEREFEKAVLEEK